MLFRGTLAAAALFGCAFVSAGFVEETPDWTDVAPAGEAGDALLSIAPFSIGNPAAAAALTTRTDRAPAPTVETRAPAAKPFRYRNPLAIKSGDTLTGVLVKAGVERVQAVKAIDALGKLFDPRRIRPGQEVAVIFERTSAESEPGRFVGMSVAPDFSREYEVARHDNGDFSATEKEKALTRTPARASGVIGSSLFVDGEKAGVPVAVLVELIRAYSWDVDFQRDIWPNDSFEVMWERVYDGEGNLVHNGEILFANLTLTGTSQPIYRFKDDHGDIGYFNDKGQSARKALMRTPIDGARLSSRYGRRKHPILGYTKVHRGVDFAAPKGTPIYAAGDGRVDHSGWKGAYGKYVRIRHNSEYSTAYGHMTRIARSAGKGKRVRQGQIIGYVGSTGRSTGAHLHYEIMRGGRQTNPLKVRMPSGRKLKGKELTRFKSARTELDTIFAQLPSQTELAANKD
ncbi:MAG: M23 family metallopeptidase [Rhodospirillales bacterium]|jgi:murein DD-endopeptidase MepM/ murein hydrolase activator NlpD|nr:M23 family metallopeptidase [Rhodospirillales bacterium]